MFHEVTYATYGGLRPANALVAKDCNRLCDRAVTIHPSALCDLTGFITPEDHLSQGRHAALRGSGQIAGSPAVPGRMNSRPRDKDRGSEHDVAPGSGSGKPD